MSTDAASPRIFAPTSLSIDDSQLCFTKSHFGRPDFDVQRFMNLARRRAGLEQIQKDLRLYLKSIQHSMIELINDDYADFVHLSSNLVSLQSAIEKIDKDLLNIWEEFESSTGDAVSTAEQIELRCEQLAVNRHEQASLRDRIAFLSGLQRLASLLNSAPTVPTVLWLEKVASCVVDITCFDLNESESSAKEKEANSRVLHRLEEVLCKEGVRSASGDCSTFPLVLSVLSLTQCSSTLTATIVADLLHPRLVVQKDNKYEQLLDVFRGVNEMRGYWLKMLGARYSGNVSSFLDQTLLTFLHTFIDKYMGMVAVPSDTRLFHKCYMATQEFIQSWPTAVLCRNLLKAVRDKFNLIVYFKLETHKFSRRIDNEVAPEAFSLVTEDEDTEPDSPRCRVSLTIVEAIEHIWSDDVYLPSLIDKLWEFTLRLLSKHLAWVKAIIQHLAVDQQESPLLPAWQTLLRVRHDAKAVHGRIFDLALERIWTKLRDFDVDTSPFGQCLTRLGVMVQNECLTIDKHVLCMVGDLMKKEFEQVAHVPKQYRWTKKAAPSTHSAYIVSAHEQLATLRNELETLELEHGSDLLCKEVQSMAYSHFVCKANEVLDSVDATGSSLSRFKRKGPATDGATDDEKIKKQIFCDVEYCVNQSDTDQLAIEGLPQLLERSRSEQAGKSSSVERVVPEASRGSESVAPEVVSPTSEQEGNEDSRVSAEEDKIPETVPKDASVISIEAEANDVQEVPNYTTA